MTDQGYQLGEGILREIKRELAQQKLELTNLRRQLGGLSSQKDCYLPWQSWGGYRSAVGKTYSAPSQAIIEWNQWNVTSVRATQDTASPKTKIYIPENGEYLVLANVVARPASGSTTDNIPISIIPEPNGLPSSSEWETGSTVESYNHAWVCLTNVSVMRLANVAWDSVAMSITSAEDVEISSSSSFYIYQLTKRRYRT